MSVCIPTYNGKRYIEECLDSVLAQTHSDFELLVLDDASRDGTADSVERRLGGDPRLRLLRNPRTLGLVGNWNRCVRLARGAWVKFVFQDDTLEPDCLSRLLRAARPGVPLVACRRELRIEDGVSPAVRRMYRRHIAEHSLQRRFPGRSFIPPREFARLMLRHPVQNCVGEPTAVMIRRSAFARLGLFNPDLVNICDWEFFARVAVNEGLCFADETLASFRVHPGAASSFNRRRRAFQAEVVDELILRHELAHAPAFEPVRREARRARPRVDLAGSLAAAGRRSLAQARRPELGPAAAAKRALQAAVRSYPRLSDGFPALDDRRRLAVARGLWEGARRESC